MTRHLPMLLKRRRQNKQVSRNAAGLVLLFGTLASVISGCGSKESNTETAQVPYEEAYQEEVLQDRKAETIQKFPLFMKMRNMRQKKRRKRLRSLMRSGTCRQWY